MDAPLIEFKFDISLVVSHTRVARITRIVRIVWRRRGRSVGRLTFGAHVDRTYGEIQCFIHRVVFFMSWLCLSLRLTSARRRSGCGRMFATNQRIAWNICNIWLQKVCGESMATHESDWPSVEQLMSRNWHGFAHRASRIRALSFGDKLDKFRVIPATVWCNFRGTHAGI
jgi:hypothetical protein